MRTIKHILVVVDPASSAQPCVDKGAMLARAHGAALTLFVCDYQSGLLPGSRMPREVIEAILKDRRAQIDRQLAALAEPLRRDGLQVTSDCSCQEHLHAGVVRKVRQSGADLVVKDTHYHGAIQRALFTNSDWHLIRECPVPLLLVKPLPWRAPIRVAAAVDPGHNDDKPGELDRHLLDAGESLAASMAGEALAVHAFDPLQWIAGMTSVAGGVAGASGIDVGFIDSLRKFHAAQFTSLLAGRPALEGHAVMLEGSPVAELPAFAVRERIDVLVTGAVSRAPLRRLFVGSTAERLLDRLPCDILVVKPDTSAQEQQPAAAH